MSQFLHSVTLPERTISADGLYQYDLSVNPLSVVMLVLRPLNDTGTLEEFASYLDVVGALNKISITHRGESVFSMSGRDAAALAFFRHGISPMQANHVDNNNFRRCVCLPLLLGRNAYDRGSCFPASRRGELVLELDVDIASTGYDGLKLSIESVELLGAKPREFERKVTATQVLPMTGDNDIDLAPGNKYRGILMYGTTGYNGATPVPTLGRLSVRLDNQEALYAATDFEVAHGLGSLWGRQPAAFDEHFHRVDATSVSTTEASGVPVGIGTGGWENYAYLDFDPSRDDEFSLMTNKSSRFHVRLDAETADTVRAVGIEVVKP